MKYLTRTQYYVLSWTWGFLMTAVGCLVGGFLSIFHDPYSHKHGWYFVVGEGWGGISIGPITIVSREYDRHTLDHEYGHSLQNCIYGPLTIFLVAIPSAVRYWYRKYMKAVCPAKKLPSYYSIWFEAQASKWGEEAEA